MKSKPISAETRAAILDAAWRLMAEAGRGDVTQAEIARAAGVSRQTVFYAFGNRTGLLTAVLRHRDEVSGVAERLGGIRTGGRPDGATLARFVETWIDYLPEVYPVGAALFAAGHGDADARAALDDRMVGALLAGLRALTGSLASQGVLAEGVGPDEAAETIWAAMHFPAWRLLVVERGWSPEAFRASRLRIVAGLLRP